MNAPPSAPFPVPDPPLSDGVVRLRQWEASDAPEVRRLVQDPEIPRFMGIPENQTLEGVQAWMATVPETWQAGSSARMAVVDAESGELVGSIAITRSADDAAIGEVGYWVAGHARGRGVASRAVRLLTEWAFDALDLWRIEITTHPDNVASQRVAERCGFRREGVLRGYAEHHGQRVDLVMFARLRTD